MSIYERLLRIRRDEDFIIYPHGEFWYIMDMHTGVIYMNVMELEELAAELYCKKYKFRIIQCFFETSDLGHALNTMKNCSRLDY